MAIVSNAHSAAADAEFALLAINYTNAYLQQNPEAATQLGDHRFDSKSSDLSQAGFEKQVVLYRRTLAVLADIKTEQLSLAHRVDYRMLRDDIEAKLFALEVTRDHEWSPLVYNPAQGIYGLLAREYAPLSVRLAGVEERLERIPAKLAAARANLKNPPRIYTETAIEQNAGAIALVRDTLEVYLEKAPNMRPLLAGARAEALASLEAYGVWLKEDLLPRSTRDFRLGKSLFEKKLRYALESDIPASEVLRKAEAELVASQQAMFATALPLYREWFADAAKTLDVTKLVEQKKVIAAVIKRLSDARPDNDTVVKQAEADLAEAAQFIRDKKLMSLPTEPVKIIVMPEFQRGVSVAYCDPAGPLDANGETFFAISPTPKKWGARQIESYFREYNNAMLKNLTVHEAMPGHYVQLAVANKNKAPTPVRSLVFSGTFAEGWATYAEQVMVDAGYGGAPVKMQQLKMRLRLIINAIIDQKIHAGNMTEKEAMDLMMNEGFQEESEAAGKWKRAQLTSAQLSTYFVGNLEVNELRRAFEAKHGKERMQEMHDTMLSFGTIAPKYVSELMGLSSSGK